MVPSRGSCLEHSSGIFSDVLPWPFLQTFRVRSLGPVGTPCGKYSDEFIGRLPCERAKWIGSGGFERSVLPSSNGWYPHGGPWFPRSLVSLRSATHLRATLIYRLSSTSKRGHLARFIRGFKPFANRLCFADFRYSESILTHSACTNMLPESACINMLPGRPGTKLHREVWNGGGRQVGSRQSRQQEAID